MTLTNHVRQIQELAETVITHSDARQYELTHCALDDIEGKVHALRRHLDNLQYFTSKIPRPRGDKQQ